MEDLVRPLAPVAAFRRQEDFLDRPTNRVRPGHFDAPGIGRPDSTRSRTKPGIVRTSCVSKSRPAEAAHSSTSASDAPAKPMSWIVTMSRSGAARKSPRTMAPLKFSSATSRSISAPVCLPVAPGDAAGRRRGRVPATVGGSPPPGVVPSRRSHRLARGCEGSTRSLRRRHPGRVSESPGPVVRGWRRHGRRRRPCPVSRATSRRGSFRNRLDEEKQEVAQAS
jgi:hypothetical protein